MWRKVSLNEHPCPGILASWFVTLSDQVLPLKPGHVPTATEIVAILPEPEDMQSDGILTIKTGDAVNNYDVYDLAIGEGGTGEYNCGLLCKVGPPDTDRTTGGRYGEPEYFQLLIDYTINLPDYLAEKTYWDYPVGFRKWRDELIDHAESLPCVDDSPACEPSDYIDPNGCGQWDFVRLSPEGVLTVKNGYRWDGPSTWPVKAPPELIRATIIHDALYDLMRLEALEPDPTGVAKAFVKPIAEWKKTGWWNRAMADCVLFMLGVEDGYDKWSAFAAVRAGGAARIRNRAISCWQHHAVAAGGEQSRFSDELPMTLRSYRRLKNAEVSRDTLANGHLSGQVDRQENGRDPAVSKFDVPSDKRLLQLSATRLRARSIPGQALSQAITTVQNYFVEDDRGNRYPLAGKYAIATVRGRKYIEVQYFTRPTGAADGVGTFNRIDESKLQPDEEFVLLFLVDPGVRIVSFSSGSQTAGRDDLTGDNLIAPP